MTKTKKIRLTMSAPLGDFNPSDIACNLEHTCHTFQAKQSNSSNTLQNFTQAKDRSRGSRQEHGQQTGAGAGAADRGSRQGQQTGAAGRNSNHWSYII